MAFDKAYYPLQRDINALLRSSRAKSKIVQGRDGSSAVFFAGAKRSLSIGAGERSASGRTARTTCKRSGLTHRTAAARRKTDSNITRDKGCCKRWRTSPP